MSSDSQAQHVVELRQASVQRVKYPASALHAREYPELLRVLAVTRRHSGRDTSLRMRRVLAALNAQRCRFRDFSFEGEGTKDFISGTLKQHVSGTIQQANALAQGSLIGYTVTPTAFEVYMGLSHTVTVVHRGQRVHAGTAATEYCTAPAHTN